METIKWWTSLNLNCPRLHCQCFVIETKTKAKELFWSITIQGLQSIQWTNQISKQIHVADTKPGKTCASKWRLVWFYRSNWITKWHEFFQLIVRRYDPRKCELHSTFKWKPPNQKKVYCCTRTFGSLIKDFRLTLKIFPTYKQILSSIVVSISACHTGDRDSFPRRESFSFPVHRFLLSNKHPLYYYPLFCNVA